MFKRLCGRSVIAQNLFARQFATAPVWKEGAYSYPTEALTIAGEYRYQTGKYVAKWLRMHGRVPGLVFSPLSYDTDIISLNDEDLTKFFRQEKHWMMNTLYDLVISEGKDFEDGTPVKPRKVVRVLPKQMWHHPGRRDHIQNINFIEFVAGKSYKVEIPVKFVGVEDCKGCKDGGVFLLGQQTIPCWWDSKDGPLPRDVECDLVNVEKGQSVHLSDLPPLPKGLRFRPGVAGPDPRLAHVATQGGEVPGYTWQIGEDKIKGDMRKKKEVKDDAVTKAEQW